MDQVDRPEPEIPPAETERLRRRDRERSAKDRGLMRTGQAKAFKQILDVQVRRAAEAAAEPEASRRRTHRKASSCPAPTAGQDDVTGPATD